MDRVLLFCVIYLLQDAVVLCEDGSNQEFHQGRFTRDIPKAKSSLVYPRKVTHTGEFVSHLIPHHYKRSYYYAKEAGLGPEDQVHYRIPIEGEEHHLELEPNHALLSPGMVVETRRAADDVHIRRGKDTQCHYRGRVRGHDASATAVSTCYGLAGFVRTKRGYYIIEPVRDQDHTTGKEHAHVLYKLDPDEILEPNCRSDGGLIHALAERAVREGKRAVQAEGSAPKDFSNNMYVETLVVLDKPFLDYHKKFDVENYAMTVMNMVYNIYEDASLGAQADVTIVRIIRLEKEDDEMNLGVNKDAETTLTFFCDWQKKMNPGDDTHPNHHDVAVLLTRVDICYDNTECGLLGLAKMGGTCDPTISCAINEDNGLLLGYTTAHEMGHTLGMDHDQPDISGCSGFMSDGKWHTVMHPTINSFTGDWSTCSQSYFKAFIDAGFGKCLMDKPSDHDFKLVDILPGVMYGATYQCKELFSQDSFVCEMGITCDSLNCKTATSACYKSNEPPAPGTSCGEKKWCYKQKCLEVGERPGAVDGSWGAWGPWSQCSRTCGAGVTSTERKCDKPKPAHGGKYCVGERKRHKICSTDPCDVSQPSFRDVQCAEFNDWTYPETKKKHTWKGIFLRGENPCALACINEDKTITTLKPQVVDGTTCHRGLRDICIGGACRAIPCDLDMESKAVEDVCGVCHGDGNSCTVQTGTQSFKKNTKKYEKVVDVPEGARNIRVQEVEPTRSHIVVKEGKTVLINGDKLGMFQVPGSKAWLGMIHNDQEALNIPGPVTKALTVYARCLEDVKLEFSLGLKKGSKTRRDNPPSYEWDWIDWSECSAQCGPGLQLSVPRCVEKQNGLVEDVYCRDIEKPDDKEKPCYEEPCAPRWMIGDWSAECQGGKRTRIVKCVKPAGEGEGESDIIDDSECKGAKPESEEECKGGGGDSCSLSSRQTDAYEAARHVPLVPLRKDGNRDLAALNEARQPLLVPLTRDATPELLEAPRDPLAPLSKDASRDVEDFFDPLAPLNKQPNHDLDDLMFFEAPRDPVAPVNKDLDNSAWMFDSNLLGDNHKLKLLEKRAAADKTSSSNETKKLEELKANLKKLDYLFSPEVLNQRKLSKDRNNTGLHSGEESAVPKVEAESAPQQQVFPSKWKRSVESAPQQQVVPSKGKRLVESAPQQQVVPSKGKRLVESVPQQQVVPSKGKRLVESAPQQQVVPSKGKRSVESAPQQQVVPSKGKRSVESAPQQQVVPSKWKRSAELRNQGHQGAEYLDNEVSLREYEEASKVDLRGGDSGYVGESEEAAFSSELGPASRVEAPSGGGRTLVRRDAAAFLDEDLTEYEEGPKANGHAIDEGLKRGEKKRESQDSGAKDVEANSGSVHTQDSNDLLSGSNKLNKRSIANQPFVFTEDVLSPPPKSKYMKMSENRNNFLQNKLGYDKIYADQGPSAHQDAFERALSNIGSNEHPLSLYDLEMERELAEKLKKRYSGQVNTHSVRLHRPAPMPGSLEPGLVRDSVGLMPPDLMDQPLDSANTRSRRDAQQAAGVDKFPSPVFYDVDTMAVASVDDSGRIIEEANSFEGMAEDSVEVPDSEAFTAERRRKRQNEVEIRSLPVRQEIQDFPEGSGISRKKLELMIPIEVDLVGGQDQGFVQRYTKHAAAGPSERMYEDAGYNQVSGGGPEASRQKYYGGRSSMQEANSKAALSTQEDNFYPAAKSRQVSDAAETLKDDGYDAAFGMADANQAQDDEVYDSGYQNGGGALSEDQKEALMDSIHQKREYGAENDGDAQAFVMEPAFPPNEAPLPSSMLSVMDMNKIMTQHLPNAKQQRPLGGQFKFGLEEPARQQVRGSRYTPEQYGYRGQQAPWPQQRVVKRTSDDADAEAEPDADAAAVSDAVSDAVADAVADVEADAESEAVEADDNKHRKRFAVSDEKRCANHSLQHGQKTNEPRKLERGKTVVDKEDPDELSMNVFNETEDEDAGDQDHSPATVEGKEVLETIEKIQEEGHNQTQSGSSDR